MPRNQTELEQVLITHPFVGICHMQVCAVSDATDEEILEVCNRSNPSGTTGGWSTVVHDGAEPHMNPCKCGDYPERVHFLVGC